MRLPTLLSLVVEPPVPLEVEEPPLGLPVPVDVPSPTSEPVVVRPVPVVELVVLVLESGGPIMAPPVPFGPAL